MCVCVCVSAIPSHALLLLLFAGLRPYYQHVEDSEDIDRDMIGGVLPIVSPLFQDKSPVEATLARVIPDMMQHNFTARPNLVAVIQQLRAAASSAATAGA